ncbi:MAG TPA: glycosyltransferase family 4 protein [Vicinamibacterales bacterium]|nr:glycosyltransferase family 4 protein [Vicinamibacterales bacterium]
MKILFVTAGAAGMYCGSCLRDNALAAELKARGHDVLLVPLYTPTLTDEPNVSEDRVFFGGVSVYLQQHAGFFRSAPRVLDKLLDAPWLIKAASSGSISTDPRSLGAMTISMLKGEDGYQRKEFEKLLEWLVSEPPPDVIQLPNAMLASLAPSLRRTLKRPVHCTLQGEDLFLDGLPQNDRKEALALIRENAESVDRFTAVSEYYAEFMATYLSIPEQKIDVVPLGINLQGFARRVGSGLDAFAVGYLARVAPEKGLAVLCDAYVRFRRMPGVERASLEVAGYLAPDQQMYLKDAERRLTSAGFGDEFHYRGVLDRAQKIDFLKTLDVFSVPTVYVEPKGLFLLEAMACGVPVVQPRHGAFPEMLKKTGGGLLVEPGDSQSLADGLYRLWKDRALRVEIGQKGFEGVREHYSVARSADRMLEVYERSMC